MKKNILNKTYKIREIALLERNLRKNTSKLHKEKKHNKNDILFDEELNREIEDAILKPFLEQSLKDFIPSPLLSYENEYGRKKAEAWETLEEYLKKIEKGIWALQKAGIRLDQNILKETGSSEASENDKPPKEIFNIPDTLMNDCYKEACKHCKNKDYEESSNILEVLLYLNPRSSLYWQLFGISEHKLGHLRSAAEALTIGLEKGSLSLAPYAHLINSLVDLNRLKEASEMITVALKIEHPTDSNADAILRALRKLENALKRK